MSKPARHGLLLAATVFLFAPTVAHAYVDPGSAGFIITSVLGFLAAGGYLVRAYLGRVKRRVLRSGRKAADHEGSNTTDGRAVDRIPRG